MSGANDAAIGVAVGEMANLGLEAARLLRDQYKRNLEEHQQRQQAQLDAAKAMRRQYLASKAVAEGRLGQWEVATQDATLVYVAAMLARSRQDLQAQLERGVVSAEDQQAAAALGRHIQQLELELVERDAATVFQEAAALRDAVAGWKKKLRRMEFGSVPMAGSAEVGTPGELAALARAALQDLRQELSLASPMDPQFAAEASLLHVRLDELEALVQAQPATVLQGLSVLEERLRGRLRELGRGQAEAAQLAEQIREIVGEASAALQAVAEQDHDRELAGEARAQLKRLAAILAAGTLDMEALEALGQNARELMERAVKAAEAEAVQRHIQGQVAEVLATLGYRVTSATNASGGESLVAALSGDVGVQMQVDQLGNFTSEMVALHEGAREVDEAQQEKMCDLMDSIFSGLRARKLLVREKKRKNLKRGRDTLPVVATLESQANQAGGSEAAKRGAMRTLD